MSATRPKIGRIIGLTCLLLLFTMLALGTNVLYTASSKSSLPKAVKLDNPTKTIQSKQSHLSEISRELSPANTALLVPMPQAGPESIATYSDDCSTPKSSFTLGETVCAKVTNAPAGFPRSVTWTNAGGIVVARNDLTTDRDTFMIPTDQIDIVNNELSVDNRGTWQVKLVPTGRSVVRASAFFTVSGTNLAADLGVYNSITSPTGDLPAGANITVSLVAFNNGPNNVPEVALTQAVPANATFVSEAQDSGPTFACTNPSSGGFGTTTCTINNLAAGAKAAFTFVYTIDANVSQGTPVAGIATIGQVSSPQTVVSELNAKDNQWTAKGTVSFNPNAPPPCSLICPTNIVTTANTTQGAQSGAIVTFDAAEPVGTCGTITTSQASGTFFPVGTTTVTSSAQGGDSCQFTVTVLSSAAPTISCQADQTVQVTGSQLEVSVTLNTPSTTGNSVTVDGTRSDDVNLTDPYPVGTTTIHWVATDADGRTATCDQRVIVTSPNAPTISCPSNKSFTATGCNGKVLTSSDIDTPTATGSNVTVDGLRSDRLDLYNDPYQVGQTTITWTATDDIGRVVSCTQVISISPAAGSDTTPPTLHVPSDVSGTTSSCSALLDDELGVATADDNCGTPTISRTGVPSVACPTPSDPNKRCETFIFPTGTTIVTYTATDGAGNVTIGTQRVTVTESPGVPPTITAPPNKTVNADAGACGATGVALGTPTTADNCSVASVTNNAPASYPVGTTTVTWTVTDSSGNTATADQTVTVIDNQNPTITPPGNVTLYTGPTATSCSVTVSNLDATLGVATTSDNCPGATTARTGGVPAGNVFPLGDTTVTYTATDAHGNTATATQKVTVVDNTPPVVAKPADITVYLPLNTTATSMVVNYPNPVTTATDNCAGTITFASSPTSGSTFSVGTTTVTVTATDAHNNSATTTFTVTVLYDFTGFFSPVGNLPTLNVVNAGRAIPVKFSLSGNKGLGIFAANSPQSGVIPCDASAPVVNLTETVTAGSSSLSYDASSDQYNYVWKTESSWANTCRQLVVTLNDGSVHTANFKFK